MQTIEMIEYILPIQIDSSASNLEDLLNAGTCLA